MFTIYSKPNCVWCDRAKQLLDSAQLDYEVIELDLGQPRSSFVNYMSVDKFNKKFPGVSTVPYILVNQPIGGFTELKAFLVHDEV